MTHQKREWHTQPKTVERANEGSCPYCHVHVQNLDAHIKSDHKGAKIPVKK